MTNTNPAALLALETLRAAVSKKIGKRRLPKNRIPGTCPYGRPHYAGPCSACTDG